MKTIMRTVVFLLVATVAAAMATQLLPSEATLAQESVTELRGAIEGPAIRPGISPAVRDLVPEAQEPSKINPPRRQVVTPRGEPSGSEAADALLPLGKIDTGRTPEPLIDFAGMTSDGAVPPDTNGDVGLNHYVQAVNVRLQIWDKSGNPLFGPIPINQLWDGQGNDCEFNNDGDPIVLYDPLADRWLVAQFALSGPYYLCVAISQTPDPTGAYYLYQFQTFGFPDYPKFGVWPDGYYVGTNEDGASAYVLERDEMLNGQPANAQYFNLPSGNFMLPSDLDGSTPPPASAPNHYYTLKDDQYWGGGPDRLEIWDFHVDWNTPGNSTFTNVATLNTTPFIYTVCGYFNFDCITQPAPGELVDAISEWPMHRFAYRNLGDHEALVGNFAIDVDNTNHSGIRWFELRKEAGNWAIYQEGTQAPDSHNRWVGSIAMDQNGNIGLGYSVSSTTVFPGIRYATRLATDPLGTLQAEASMIEGNGVQTNGFSRWGDYAAMSVDPVDDCTFWYTNEYYPVTSQRTWHTRIGAFRLPECGGVSFSIHKTASHPTPMPGELIGFTIAIQNTSPYTATGGLVTDMLPSELIFAGPVTLEPPDAGVPGSAPPDLVTDLIVLPGQHITVTFPVTVSTTVPDGTALVNTAGVSSAEAPDPVTGSATITVTYQADLALGMGATPDPVEAGQPLTYTLQVENAGPFAASSVVLTDSLPAGAAFSSATPSQGTCSPQDGSVLCELGDLTAGGGATITLVAIPTAGGANTNLAIVTAATHDPDGSNNEASVTTQVIALADLAVGKSADKAQIEPGGELTYTVTVSNLGPSVAQEVVLTDTLPVSVTILHVYPDWGSCELEVPNPIPTILCYLGDMPAGAEYHVQILVAVDAQAHDDLVNLAKAASHTTDPEGENNQVSLLTELYAPADLEVTKSGPAEAVYQGQVVTFTLTITNHGPYTAAGVVVTDTLPAGMILLEADPNQGSCTPGSGAVSCALGNMAAGATAEILLTAVPGAMGAQVNHAIVYAQTEDPDEANNQAEFLFEVLPAGQIWLPLIQK